MLGVRPCSILRIWRLWARTKNEYMMDDFSTLAIREPWLLEKSFYFYCFHLASRKRNWRHKVVGIYGMRPIRQNFPKDHDKKGRLMTEFHNFLYERWLQVGTSKNNLAHLYLLCEIWGFDNSSFLRCENLQVGAMLMLAKTLCTCLCGMVLMMLVRMTRLPICVSDCKGNQK
jgi:hypothetical protein